jgi:hypothetical protein
MNDPRLFSLDDLEGFEIHADNSTIEVIHSPCRDIVASEAMPPADLASFVSDALDHDCWRA